MATDLNHRARNIAQYAASANRNMSPDGALNFKDRALCMLEDGRIKPNDSLDKAVELVYADLAVDYMREADDRLRMEAM